MTRPGPLASARPRRFPSGWVVALTVGLVVGLGFSAGCGVPTSSGVQYVGPGPEEVSGAPGDGVPPPSADAATNPREQVMHFLQAAAGSPETAADRVRTFLRPGERRSWQPDEQIRVIRLLQEPFVTDHVDGGWVVELTAQPVGELHPRGYLDGPVSTEPVDYRFRVVMENGPLREFERQSYRLRIADPPPHLLLLDTALTNPDYFYPHPIYFWDADHRVLVPDLRWLPLAGETADQHPWTVVRWLLEGPSPGLRAEGLPAGAQPHGTPVWEDDRLVVNFNTAAVEGQSLNDLATQLAWSLLQLRDGAELELRIDDRPQQVWIEEPDWISSDPIRFAILDGVVHPYASDWSGEHGPSVLEGEVNSGVRAAALTAGGRVAALVRASSADARPRLWVAEASGGGTATSTGLRASAFGQPVWLAAGPGQDPVGLVVADGTLHRFTSAGGTEPVSVPGLADAITAVAVAPEQRRLALAAGDKLYVAQLRYDEQMVTVQGLRLLATTVRELAGVAFSHENLLVVAGERDDRVGLYELSVDGASETHLLDLGNASVTTLVAHPTRDERDPSVIMYEANGQAYTFTALPNLIHAEELLAPPEEADAPPRAPFFLHQG